MKQSRYFPNWLRQRVEAIIWTLKHQLGLERHGGRIPPSAGGPASCSACSPSTPAPGTTGLSAPRQALPDRLRPLSPDLTRFPLNDPGDQQGVRDLDRLHRPAVPLDG